MSADRNVDPSAEGAMPNFTLSAKIVAGFKELLASAGVPESEFDPVFAEAMCRCMMVSFYKYGRLAEAYPDKFDAMSDIRTRTAKYRETGNRWYLVDAANFAMIEAMRPRREGSHWGTNDQADSPGRNNAAQRRLEQVDNRGGRIGGDTFLHIPHEEQSNARRS